MVLRAGEVAELIKTQRYLQLGETRGEQPVELLLDPAEAVFDGLASHPQGGRRRGRVALGGKVGAERLSQHRGAFAGTVKRRQVDVDQRSRQRLVSQRKREQRDIAIAREPLRPAQCDQPRRLSLPVREAKALDSSPRLADGQRHVRTPFGQQQASYVCDREPS